MSTRATIGVVNLNTGDYRGRIVQCDGYGRGVGAQLSKIVARDGLNTAIQVLIEDHRGWFSVSADRTLGTLNPDRKLVPGYGIALRDDCTDWVSGEWITGNVQDGLAIHDYLFAGTGDHAEVWARSCHRFHRIRIAELDEFDWKLFDDPDARDAEALHAALAEMRNHAAGHAPFSGNTPDKED